MDKSLLMFRGGIRTVKKTLADGQEHDLHYRACTPNELAAFAGGENTLKQDAEGMVARERHRAKFIATFMCTETGDSLLTKAESEQITTQMKAELCSLIVTGSQEIGDAGKD